MAIKIYADNDFYVFKCSKKTWKISKDQLIEALQRIEEDLEHLQQPSLIYVKLESDSDTEKFIKRIFGRRYGNTTTLSRYNTIKIPEKFLKLLRWKSGDRLFVKVGIDGYNPVLIISKLEEAKT